MNKYTKQDLLTMQSLSLDRKIQVAQTRIIEWYVKNQGKVFVSFSGGKDSTVLIDLVRRIYPDIPAVFVDTGLEYPEIREFVKTIKNVTLLRPEMNFKRVIETYGYPVGSKRVALNIEYGRAAALRGDTEMYDHYVNGKRINKRTGEVYKFMPIPNCLKPLMDSHIKVSGKCCSIMKKLPLDRYSKETGRKPIVGIMATESKQREQARLQTGCNNFSGANPKSKPMSFWTEQDVLEYIERFGLSYSKIYGDIVKDERGKYNTTGAQRTGCMFCMFGVHIEKEPNRFQRMKVTHPKQYEFCMKPTTEGGLGLEDVLDLIGVKC